MTQRFDYALLRAVAAPQRAVELARPWLAERGEVWIWIGPEADVEGVCGSLGLASGGRIVRVPASA
jgi:hypothetical protein